MSNTLTAKEKQLLDMEWSDATMREWRNTPWGDWSEIRERKKRFRKSHENGQSYADRIINFQHRFDYNGVWAPTDLKAFDIVRCDIPTNYETHEEFQLTPRNCLVLGMHLDQKNLELQNIVLVKFAHEKAGTIYRPEYELYLDRLDPETRMKMPFGHSEILRTGRIEFIPVDDLSFGFYIDRVGRLDVSLDKQVEDALSLGYKHKRQHSSSSYLSRTQGQIFVPSLDPEDWSNKAKHIARVDFDELGLEDYLGTRIQDLDDEDRNNLKGRMTESRLLKAAGRDYSMRCEVGLLTDQDRYKRNQEEEKKAIIAAFREKYGEEKAEAALKAAEDALKKHDEGSLSSIRTHLHEDGNEEDLTLAELPSLSDLLEQQMEKLNSNNDLITAAHQEINNQEIDANSLGHLENLGIGGFYIEPQINLPDQLWRGRYLMMRIPDIAHNTDDTDFGTHRPCMLHKAYAKVNEQGEAELAGIEAYPCTRGAAKIFEHKLKVRPLQTSVKKPSFLIAERLIRVPISGIHIQPDQPRTGNFFELLPHMIEKFDEKVAWCEKEKGAPFIIGEKDIPKGWIEIDLPPAPNERVRKKLEHLRGIQFTPQGTKKLSKASGAPKHKGRVANIRNTEAQGEKRKRLSATHANHSNGSPASPSAVNDQVTGPTSDGLHHPAGPET